MPQVCLTLGEEDAVPYLSFVVENFGCTVSFKQFYSSEPNLSLHFWKMPKSTQTPNAFIFERLWKSLIVHMELKVKGAVSFLISKHSLQFYSFYSKLQSRKHFASER